MQWGLRGDPFLWRELKERFINIEMPETKEQLKALIEKEYEVTTGHPIKYEKYFGLERFRSHGMSSGIPLLVSRHA